MKKFTDISQGSLFQVTANFGELLPKGHLAFTINEIVDNLDLSEFLELYKSKGRPAYHPAIMLKLFFYGCCTKRYSSRDLEQAALQDVACRYLSNNQVPDNDTFLAFRERHGHQFKSIFVQILSIATKMGLTRMGHVSIDGTKMKANASKRKTLNLEALQKRAEELTEAIKNAESRRDGVSLTDKQLADQKELLRKIQAARKELEEELQAKDSEREALVNARAKRIEKRREGLISAGQRFVQLREARGISKNELMRQTGMGRNRILRIERGEGCPTPGEVDKLCGALQCGPEEFPEWLTSAKAERPLRNLTAQKQPNPRRNLTDPDSRLMKPNHHSSSLQCYNGQCGVDSENQIIVACDVVSETNDCKQLVPMLDQVIENTGECPDVITADTGYCSASNIEQAAERGTKPLVRPSKLSAKAKEQNPTMAAQRSEFAKDEVKKLYNQRSAIVEPVFGRMRGGLAFNKFLRCGLENVRVEWIMVCTVHNILKIAKHWR